jgi:two-component system CheB/CheR fusion protein
MPRSAIAAVNVDIVAGADELPLKLLEFLRTFPVVKAEMILNDKSKGNLDKIILLIREQSGHDFSHYKINTLFRRIERRKGVHQIDKLNSYVRFCQENPKELEILFKELLIGVTSFFRDSAVWEKLKSLVLPKLIAQLPAGYVLRAWVTACSTGEEAYSLAIIFKEAVEKAKKNLSLQIFATDLDQDAIDEARKGLYGPNIAADVSAERLERFFTIEPKGYRVTAAIREMVVFAPQNVIKDPPFTKLDLLTCRNMLIYMESDLQKKLMSLFNYSLNPGGIMVLGTAETSNGKSDGFSEIDNKLKIYCRTSSPTATDLADFPSSFSYHKTRVSEHPASPQMVENIQFLADQAVLQRFAPASALVNEKGDIIYMTGRIGKYLEPVAGKANYNIYVMGREGLRSELPGALRKAMQNFNEFTLRNIKVGIEGSPLFVDITIQRLDTQNSIKGMILLLFTDVTSKVNLELKQKTSKRSSSGRTKTMELMLQSSQEDLQGLREEMLTSQEELKSTNEELQSTNEELQSTNEELTTSKEEMQSLNEELQTVNVELQSKVSDFVQANEDMKNLLNSTEIATLFLDKDLNIRRFTEQATKIFKLRKVDIGRPFTDQASDLKYPEIDQHARQVLDTLISIETPIQAEGGRWYNVRILPYRTLDDRIDGLVITLTDITIAKKTENALNVSEIRYRSLFESAKEGILILDAETGKIVDVNPFLVVLLGYSKEQFLAKTIWQIGFLKDLIANKDKFLELQQKEMVRYENLPLETADGREINVEFVSNVYLVAQAKVVQCFIRETM